MLAYADVCKRMLTYADVCWRMLAYADEARDVFAKLFAPECERKNMSEFTMLCALMVRPTLR
jgi:hypothetical protein